MKSEDIGLKLQQATADITQKAILMSAALTNRDAAASAHIGCMAALGALQPTAMIFAKRPQLSLEEIAEKGDVVCMGLLTPETLVFTALVTAFQQQDATPDGNITVEFGPHILFEALEAAEKVFGKSIDHLLDSGMVKAARAAGAGSNLPLEQLMAKRSLAHETPRTVQ